MPGTAPDQSGSGGHGYSSASETGGGGSPFPNGAGGLLRCSQRPDSAGHRNWLKRRLLGRLLLVPFVRSLGTAAAFRGRELVAGFRPSISRGEGQTIELSPLWRQKLICRLSSLTGQVRGI
jgi:hypothetical protein